MHDGLGINVLHANISSLLSVFTFIIDSSLGGVGSCGDEERLIALVLSHCVYKKAGGDILLLKEVHLSQSTQYFNLG